MEESRRERCAGKRNDSNNKKRERENDLSHIKAHCVIDGRMLVDSSPPLQQWLSRFDFLPRSVLIVWFWNGHSVMCWRWRQAFSQALLNYRFDVHDWEVLFIKIFAKGFCQNLFFLLNEKRHWQRTLRRETDMGSREKKRDRESDREWVKKPP